MNRWRGLAVAAAAFAGSAAYGFSNVYVFGDSLSDVGNDYIATGGAEPASPPYYNGRFSNGPLWVEALASAYGVTLAPSLAGGTDYAFGGAQTGGGFNGLVPNVDTQIGLFQSSVGTFQATDLVTVWAGANDFLGGQPDPSIPAANMASSLTALYNLGARNILVPNLPGLGYTPGVISQGPAAVAAANAWTAGFDGDLAADLNATASTLSGLNLYTLDVNSIFDQVLADPGAYGFTDTTDSYLDNGSIGDPNTYIFFDRVHPTAPMHQIIGNAAIAAVPEPASLLALGIGLVALRRRRR